jgi:hypothetical protein
LSVALLALAAEDPAEALELGAAVLDDAELEGVDLGDAELGGVDPDDAEWQAQTRKMKRTQR